MKKDTFPIKTGIIVGTAFVGILVGTWFVANPPDPQSTQIGYRGTSMGQVQTHGQIAALAAANVMPESDAPIVPEPGAALAKDVYENVQVLGDVSEDNFNRLMVAITNWVSPDNGVEGQGCAYCHGNDGNFAADDLYTKVVARRMLQMTRDINTGWTDHVKATGVTCYTCHRGQNVPQNIWFSNDYAGHRGGMSAGADRAEQNGSSMAVAGASLPRDPFTKFLLDDAPIRVRSVGPRVPVNQVEPGTKDAEWTYALMMQLSTGLGVNCTYCHQSGDFASWEQSPPQRVTAWHGIQMVRALNKDYLQPLGPTYPPNRLGPTGDAPKAFCATCHAGAPKPLLGQSMMAAWPELATTGVPVYQAATQ